jgi:hypothetical protein
MSSTKDSKIKHSVSISNYFLGGVFMLLNLINLEKEIEKRFVIGLRAIFENDSYFIYNEDDETTKVIITPEYPDKDIVLKTPHLIVTNISYNMDTQTSFYNNFYDTAYDKNGFEIGKKFATVIPYNANILCLAEYYLSKDLANKVVDYAGFSAREVFDYMGLNVKNLSKSPTGAQQQFPEKIFETAVSIQGHVEWHGSKTNVPDVESILNKIKAAINVK